MPSAIMECADFSGFQVKIILLPNLYLRKSMPIPNNFKIGRVKIMYYLKDRALQKISLE